MSWAGLDQRVFPRYSTPCDITISGGGKTIKTKTQNIGIGGVCVILGEALEKLSEVKLHIVLEASTPTIDCRAKVVWMIPGKELSSPKKHYDTGFEFLDLDPKDCQRIQAFVDKLNQ